MRTATTTVLISLLLPHAHGQNVGTGPASKVVPIDVYSFFRLPPLRDSANSVPGLRNLSLQAGRRAVALNINSSSAIEAWKNAAAIAGTFPNPAVTSVETRVSPQSAAELNRILSDPAIVRVKITSDHLSLEAPIDISRAGLSLNFSTAVITAAPAVPWIIRVHNASGIVIAGGRLSGGASGILIDQSDKVIVSGTDFQNLSGAGIAVTGSSQIRLSRNRFSGLQLASVILHRNVTQSVVESNVIQGNLGTANLAAGILLTDREVDITSSPRLLFGPGGYWPTEQPITQRLRPPHDNAIVWNTVSGNRSSGIYSDGGVRNVIAGNTIQGNAKEGICLDNGSTANVVTGNTIAQNGQRWGQSDDVLAREYVSQWGRLADGTAVAKVPGISLDNALYNVVISNSLEHNFGGGIKMVRTSYFNAIGLNSLLNNNDGESAAFHFFGIELGAAGADETSTELDFTPSRGNIVFSNLVRGSHYAGIFFAPGSDLNDIFDNTIMDATNWALESAEVMANTTLNNLTNLDSVNISSGLAPAGLR